METMPLRQRGPWHRGGVPRSYVPASVFVSVGCAIYLVFIGVFLILVGSIMTGVSNQKRDPQFDSDFFRKHDSGINNVLRIVGPTFLGVGFTILAIAVILCVVIVFMARKQEKKRHERQGQVEQPLQPPPTSAYPHQPMPQNYPTATEYPTQPVGQQFPGSNYPPQNQYPPQPANYPLPPMAPYPSTYGSQYPPSDYPAPITNVEPQNPQYIPSGNYPAPDAAKFS